MLDDDGLMKTEENEHRQHWQYIYVYETWFVRVYTTTHVHTHWMYVREVKKKENARTWHWYIIAHRGSLTYQSCTYIDNVPFTKKKKDVKRMKFSCDDDLNLLYRFKNKSFISVVLIKVRHIHTRTDIIYVTTQVYTLFVDLFLFIFIIHTHTLFHIWYMFSFHYNNNHNNNDNQLTILVYL